MAKLTREKIGALINSQPIGNFSSLLPLNETKLEKSSQVQKKIDSPFSFKEKESMVIFLNSLEGKELFLIMYLLNVCQKNCSLKTPPMISQELTKVLNVNANHLRNIVLRLTKKRILKVTFSKSSKQGIRIFEFDKDIYSLLIDRKILYTTSIDNSDNQSIKNTIIDGNNQEVLDSVINLESLYDIGLTKNHITQIIKQGKLMPEQIQESIDHFAFDLIYNDKAKAFKSSPLDVFVGILRKGSYYNAPSNYESQNARNLRLSLEAKMQREQTEKELEDKLKEFEWKEWSEKLTERELMEFYVEETDLNTVPEKSRKVLIKRNALNNAKRYFESEVWPTKKNGLNENV